MQNKDTDVSAISHSCCAVPHVFGKPVCDEITAMSVIRFPVADYTELQ
jgi:hypothetical protein